MLGKCLWKMHKCSNNVLSGRERMPFQPAIDAFKTAIEALPGRRDSKHADKDPTLEPHYKLASVVHKLVSSRRLTVIKSSKVVVTRSKETDYASRLKKGVKLSMPPRMQEKFLRCKMWTTGKDISCRF